MDTEKTPLEPVNSEAPAPLSQTPQEKQSTLARVMSILIPVVIGAIALGFLSFIRLSAIGLVFGIIYLLLAWLSNYLARKNLWPLSLLLAGLVIFSLSYTVPATFFMGFVDYMQTSAQNQDRDTPQIDRDYMDGQKDFDWTIAELQELVIGQSRLEEVIAQKGKATEANVLYGDYTLSYDSSDPSYALLFFGKNEDGEQVLTAFSASLPVEEIKTNIYDSSLWEKTAYEALIVGDWETGENGSLLTDVLREHPVPSLANHIFSDGRQTITLIYSNATASEQQPQGCLLTFLTTDKGESFHLIDKTHIEEE